MRTQLYFVLTLVFLLAFSVYGYTENSKEVVELKEKGSINWSRGVVQANGIGIPPMKMSDNSDARTAVRSRASARRTDRCQRGKYVGCSITTDDPR